MGACNFETARWGKTPHEAFRAAVEDAQYEYGHGGYTGTIAEKGVDGFVLVELPPRLPASKLVGWAYDGAASDGVEYLRERVADAKRYAASAKPGTVLAARRSVKQAEKDLQAAERRAAKFKREVGPHLSLVERVARIADDKWGPAVCVELKGAERARYLGKQPKRGQRAFLFFGMASS